MNSRILYSMLLCLCMATNALAFSVTVQWDNYDTQFSDPTKDPHDFFYLYRQEDGGTWQQLPFLNDPTKKLTTYRDDTVGDQLLHDYCYKLVAGSGLIVNAAGIVPQSQLRVVFVDSQETVVENAPGANVLDGNAATFWHTQWQTASPGLPHTIILDIQTPILINAITYLPRQDGSPNGMIATYQLFVSLDGTAWGAAVGAGVLPSNTLVKRLAFTTPQRARYVKLVALSEVNGNPWTSAAELNIEFALGVVMPSTGAVVSAPSATACTQPRLFTPKNVSVH